MSGKSFVVFYFLVLRKVSAFLSDFGNSDTAGAWEVIEQVKSGKITGRTAYGELVTIKNEWPGTDVVNEAEYLIDTMFSEYKFRKKLKFPLGIK